MCDDKHERLFSSDLCLCARRDDRIRVARLRDDEGNARSSAQAMNPAAAVTNVVTRAPVIPVMSPV